MKIQEMTRLQKVELQLCLDPTKLKLNDLAWLVERCKYLQQLVDDAAVVLDAQRSKTHPIIETKNYYPNGDNA